MWKGPKEFLTYTKKQRNGLIVLMGVVLFIQVLLYLHSFLPTPPQKKDYEHLQAVIIEWQRAQDSLNHEDRPEVNFVAFDPNTVTINELKALGLKPYLAARIEKYREKGGRFRQKEDLLNIYGMDSAWYHLAAPYVQIEGVGRKETFANKREKKLNLEPFKINSVTKAELQSYNIKEWQARRIITYREKVHPFKTKDELFKVYGFDSAFVKELLPYVIVDQVEDEKTTEKIAIVELNSADSLDLIAVKGIGPVFANRILEYRAKLGGFYTKEQLLEVYGIDEEHYKKMAAQLSVNQDLIKKIDLNKATFKELLHHPYLNYEQVKSIVSFREKVRPFKHAGEVSHLELIDDALFSKIANYLNPSLGDELKE